MKNSTMRRFLLQIVFYIMLLSCAASVAASSYVSHIQVQNNTEKTITLDPTPTPTGIWDPGFTISELQPHQAVSASIRSSQQRDAKGENFYWGGAYLIINGEGMGYGCGIRIRNIYKPGPWYLPIPEVRTMQSYVESGDTRANCAISVKDASGIFTPDVMEVEIVVNATH